MSRRPTRHSTSFRFRWTGYALAALTAGGALLLAGCNGDSDDGGLEQTPIDNPSPATTGEIPTEGPDADIAIEAQNTAFAPQQLQAPAGETVAIRFVNRDPFPHSFSIYRDESASEELFHIEPLPAAESTTQEFQVPAEPGEYYFHCDIHPDQMTGTFVAE